MATTLETLAGAVQAAGGDALRSVTTDLGEVTAVVRADGLIAFMRELLFANSPHTKSALPSMTSTLAPTRYAATIHSVGPCIHTENAGSANIKDPRRTLLRLDSAKRPSPSRAPRNPLVTVVGTMPTAAISKARRASACHGRLILSHACDSSGASISMISMPAIPAPAVKSMPAFRVVGMSPCASLPRRRLIS